MLAAILLIAQQPRIVTFTHPCASAAVVLEALGKELGVPMKPTGSVQQDYFLASFKDVPVDHALERIAKTLNASWRDSNGVRYLERTAAQEQQDFDAEYDERAKAIREVLAKRDRVPFTMERAEVLATMERDFGDTQQIENWERFQSIARQLPGHRAMLGIAELIDLDATLRSTETPVEFSSMSGKQPLPAGAAKVVEQLVSEWAAYSSAGAKVALPAESVYLKYSRNSAELMQGLQLSVHLYKDHVLFMLSLLVDRQWQNLGYHMIPYAEQSRVPEWVGGLDMSARVSELALDAIKPALVGEGRDGLKRALVEGRTGDVALAAAGELILQAAQGRNIVAALPDSAYIALARSELPADAQLSSLFAILVSGAVVAEREDTWLTVRPKRPYSERRTRMDRGAFQRMCKYADEHKDLPLDEYADLVATTVEDATMETATHLFGRAFKLSSGLGSTNLAPLRMYGLLSRAERAQAKSGEAKLAGRPDFNRFALVVSKVSQHMFDPGETRPLVQKRPGRELQEALVAIPSGVQWSVTVKDQSFLQPYNPELKVGTLSFAMDVQTFAVNYLLAQRRGDSSGLDFSRVAKLPGSAVNIGIQRLDGNGGGRHFGRYADPLAAVVYGSFNDLPKSLQDEVNAAIERERKTWGGG